MLNDQRNPTSHATIDHEDRDQEEDELQIREIHALTPPRHPSPPPATNRRPRREPWETHSRLSSSLSTASTDGENFTTMSREFSALVLAGSSIDRRHNSGPVIDRHENEGDANNNLRVIGEDDMEQDTNPLAIVPDNNPFVDAVVSSPRRGELTTADGGGGSDSPATARGGQTEVSVQRVKKEEVEAKISAWQNAKVAKINNRFKREDSVIVGWEKEQIQKATTCMKKVERKLEEKRARALEKMENEVAKAHRKAEEKRASAEAKRGTKVAKVFEIANLMRAVGRPPTKKSFF